MSLYNARKRAAQLERRRSARFAVDLEALFRSISAERMGRLANISEQGAKLVMDEPPREGISGWLAFAGQEVFCKVIWTAPDGCGVEFERPLSQQVLVAIAGDQVAQAGPVANAGKIQMGRRRGGRLVASGG